MPLREHPFNLEGAGWLWVFLGKKMSVSEMAEQNILLALCASKNILFLYTKNNVATTCREKNILLRCEAKTNILTPKKPIAPL